MIDDFQTSIPWKTVSCSRHAPGTTGEERKKNTWVGWEKDNIEHHFVSTPKFKCSVLKTPFLRFGAIHILLTQCLSPFWVCIIPECGFWTLFLSKMPFRRYYYRHWVDASPRAHFSGLQNGEFICSIRVLILIKCYYTSNLTTVMCVRQDIIKFVLEIRKPKLREEKDFAQGQTTGR